MLQIFYHSVVASVIFYAVVCWGSRVKAADASRLNKLIKATGSVLGVELDFDCTFVNLLVYFYYSVDFFVLLYCIAMLPGTRIYFGINSYILLE